MGVGHRLLLNLIFIFTIIMKLLSGLHEILNDKHQESDT
jgi:hypothetical protein